MYRTCLSCTADLGENTLFEFLPVGRRIAFDSGQGRLWVICPACMHWNLVPFDRRLETIDSGERLFRGTPTRYATGQIGMARHVSGVTLVRVGAPLGEEFASWRYGEMFRKRRRRSQWIAGGAAVPFVLLVQGDRIYDLVSGHWAMTVGTAIAGLNSWNHYGMIAKYVGSIRQRLRVRHPETNASVTLKARHLKGAVLTAPDDRPATLRITRGEETLTYAGTEMETMVPRVLARLNAADGSAEQLREAVDWARRLSQTLPGGQMYDALSFLKNRKTGAAPDWVLATTTPAARLALEMFANEDAERRVLNGELAFLERQWREAEALATIADGLAIPAELSGEG